MSVTVWTRRNSPEPEWKTEVLKAEYGTRDWFVAARLDLLETTRALQSLNMAAGTADALASRWDELDATLRFALLTSTIISYGRPFTDRRTDRGVRRYKLKRIANEPGFDVTLHRHILQLRHKLVAHSDEDFSDARIHAQAALISKDNGEPFKVIAEVGARSTALWLLKDRDVAERWRVHIVAATNAAVKDARGLLEAYFAAARAHPSACPLLDIDGTEEKLLQFRKQISHGETLSVPLPEMPLSHLKVPPLTEERDAYVFQLLSLITRGVGTTITDVGDGWRTTSTSLPGIAPASEDSKEPGESA